MNFLQRVGTRLTSLVLTVTLLLSGSLATAQTVTYFDNDPSGTPVLATDANGNVVWKESYGPFGQRFNNPPAEANNKIGFAGKPFDPSIGLSYSGARYYDPMLGRFMGVDPVDVRIDDIHSFGRYTYANNSPYVFVDPNGREPHRIINQLFPRGDPFRAAGEAFGAHAAYIAGMVNGDEALKSAAIEGMRENVTTEDGIAAASMLLGGRMGREVPNCAIVCRGGTCTTDLFRTGSGVSTDATTGKLSGISTGVGDSVAAASKNIPHAKVGVTTAGEIRAAGGEVVNDRGNHAEVSGLTAERAADLFKNVQRNPNK